MVGIFKRVESVTPVDGWALCFGDGDPHGRWQEYVAVRGDDIRQLGVSRFLFLPNQARFAWLVRRGFPRNVLRAGGTWTPITDDDIDLLLPDEEGNFNAL